MKKKSTISPRIGIFSVGEKGFRVVSSRRQILPTLPGALEINAYGAHYLTAFEQVPWANETILIGREKGQSISHQMTEEMLVSYTADIELSIKRFDLIYIIAGLGDATETKLAQLVTEVTKSAGIFTVCVVSTPVDFEGKKRTQTALHGLHEIRKYSDSTFVVDLNRIFEREAENISIEEFSEMADQMFLSLYYAIKAETIGGGLNNADIKDIKRILTRLGNTAMGSVTAVGKNRLMEATMQAIDHSLLGRDTLIQAQGVLVLIRSQEGYLTVDDSSEVFNIVKNFTSKDADLAYTVYYDGVLKNSVEVSIFATGI